MQTLKIKYSTSKENLDIIFEYQKQYSKCLHYMYNRIQEGLNEKQCRESFPNISGIDRLDFIMKECAIKEAIQLKDKKHIIFGGKKNFFDRLKGNISKDEYRKNRISPLYVIGRQNLPMGNQKFKLKDDLSILFCPTRYIKIQLDLYICNNYKNILAKLYQLGISKEICLTYKIDQKYVYISFDEMKLSYASSNRYVENRVLGIDLNPNYIGWSIVNWKSETEFKVVKTGVYSIKDLNDKDFKLKGQGYTSQSKERIYISNKRRYETIQIVKNIINKAIYYKCQLVSIEDLNIKSSDKELGKHFNKLVNNSWNRCLFTDNIQKRCNIFGIKLLKVKPEYSSFIGNFLYRSLQLPDMVLASIELGRRGYEFYNQYISKTKEIKKNIVQPDLKLFNDLIIKSLEEFDIQREQFKDLIGLYYLFKKSKILYRLSIDKFRLQFSRLFSNKSVINVITEYRLI